MTTQQILRVNRSLILQDFPDDIINLVLEYSGDLRETEHDLINRHCFYRPKTKDHKNINAWFMKGNFCSVCDKFLMMRSLKALKGHINTKYHRKNVNKVINENKDIHDKFGERYINSICKEFKYMEFNRKHLSDIYLKKRNINWKH